VPKVGGTVFAGTVFAGTVFAGTVFAGTVFAGTVFAVFGRVQLCSQRKRSGRALTRDRTKVPQDETDQFKRLLKI
jgi:hypothetical protein